MAVVSAALALYWIQQAVLLTFAGVLLALVLGGLADGMARITRLPRTAALACVCVAAAALSIAFFAWFGPRLADQARLMTERLPAALDRIERRIERFGWYPSGVVSDFTVSTEWIAPTLGALRGAGGGVVALIVIFFIGIYVSFQPRLYLGLTLSIVPISRRERIRDVLLETGRTLQVWLVARAVCMLIVGLLTGGGLALLGVELAVALGVLAGVLNFVPNFGPVIAAIPAILIGFLSGPMTALWVLALYLGVQAIDNYLVGPLLAQRTVHLPAAIGILSQIAFALLLGLPGLLLATPIAVAAGVLVRRLYVEDVLGDAPAADDAE